MTDTGAAVLLATWEAGLAEAPAGRALLLHRTARPDLDGTALPALPVGRRESDLFALRRALFGDRMQVRLDCAACAADMEFDLDAGQFAPRTDGQEVTISENGWEVAFRLPGVADLTAAARAADPRAALLARCLVTATHHGTAAPASSLPAPVQRRIADAVEAADPGADVTIDVACPDCGQATRAELDIASYLWTELDAWARDVLLDVHLLATAYGWSEPQILALSPLRRRYYLELCADV
ncbi:hypothetical protein STRCI_000915 [Streptomyces cinnabarinus]|uniref:Phage baseplate protein n=1 Tax=Streptomyces cinnabarinus TaxID=67287 RepID=A0ABY7K6R7_9ACTN|nr:hypothetical protein [Streptomyces cinnabarinus]WAZ19838.1 hypothetical protein STRCI_000915 [Streptomyces cinnabarinus]